MSEVATTEQRGVALFVHPNPVAVLLQPEQFDKFYEDIRAEVSRHVPDTSTAKGRGEISSLAYKVARTKTFLDDTGKRLNEDARSQINKVDASRREMREKLDALKTEVRRPLDEWEAQEHARQATIVSRIDAIRQAGFISPEDTSASVEQRLRDISKEVIDPTVFIDETGIAKNTLQIAMRSLGNAHTRLFKEEADRAELERLRAEKAERDQQDAERREAERMAAEKAAREKAEAERKARAEAEERQRVEKAAEDARLGAERKAAAEKRDAEIAYAAALKREQAERERIEREHREAEQCRIAVAQQAAAEQAKRDADKKHRAVVMGAAKAALITAGDISEDAAKKIVLAIVAGEIPQVSLRF